MLTRVLVEETTDKQVVVTVFTISEIDKYMKRAEQ